MKKVFLIILLSLLWFDCIAEVMTNNEKRLIYDILELNDLDSTSVNFLKDWVSDTKFKIPIVIEILNNPMTFPDFVNDIETILERLDDLIVYVVTKFAHKNPQFRNIDLQDFYQSAIEGLYKGIDSAVEKELGSILQARLIAYMKSQMKIFCRKLNEKPSFVEFYKLKNTIVPEESVYRDIESEFLAERYRKFIDDKVISFEEYELLVLRYVDKAKIKDMAVKVRRSETWVRRRLRNSLNRIRYVLRRKGFEDV